MIYIDDGIYYWQKAFVVRDTLALQFFHNLQGQQPKDGCRGWTNGPTDQRWEWHGNLWWNLWAQRCFDMISSISSLSTLEKHGETPPFFRFCRCFCRSQRRWGMDLSFICWISLGSYVSCHCQVQKEPVPTLTKTSRWNKKRRNRLAGKVPGDSSRRAAKDSAGQSQGNKTGKKRRGHPPSADGADQKDSQLSHRKAANPTTGGTQPKDVHFSDRSESGQHVDKNC